MFPSKSPNLEMNSARHTRKKAVIRESFRRGQFHLFPSPMEGIHYCWPRHGGVTVRQQGTATATGTPTEAVENEAETPSFLSPLSHIAAPHFLHQTHRAPIPSSVCHS
ncbi:hypothetical protein TcCL_ESM00413 [Trypanosoma cruzi]|nr:hypothetical protein TcCL_ESM00413 [Trypanosoma cruzi]